MFARASLSIHCAVVWPRNRGFGHVVPILRYFAFVVSTRLNRSRGPAAHYVLAFRSVSPDYILAFLLSLLVAASVSQIYYLVRSSPETPSSIVAAGTGGDEAAAAAGGRGSGLAEELFVQLPFSLYHGWTIVLVV